MFIDACTKYTWIYLLRNKSETFQIFLNFKTQVELQHGHKIKNIQSDWGREFRALSTYFTTEGIHHRISCPGAHQQNGTAERKHRLIIDNGLTIFANASMPLRYWDKAFCTIVYLFNRLPTSL